MALQRRQAAKQLRAKRTRGHLLAAARRVFAERGYQGATIDDVAEAAGCTKGACYFHFASKEEILLTLLEEWANERRQRLEQATGGDRASDGVAAVLGALVSPAALTGREARLVLQFWSQAERSAKVRRHLLRAYRTWREALRGAFTHSNDARSAAISPEDAADVALTLYNGLVVHTYLSLPASAGLQNLTAVLEQLAAPPTFRAAS